LARRKVDVPPRETSCEALKQARQASRQLQARKALVGQTGTARCVALGSFSKKVRITVVDDKIKVLRTSGKRFASAWCRDTTVSR